MKKVLIALDYDPTAQKVAEAGYSLAKAMGAEVILVHVMADMVYYSSTAYAPIMGFNGFIDRDFLQSDIEGGVQKASQHFLERSKHHLGDETIQTLVKEGSVWGSVLEAAKDWDVDIIVMGSHSRRWLEQIVMGSETEKVLHHTTVPMFIIPTKKDSHPKDATPWPIFEI